MTDPHVFELLAVDHRSKTGCNNAASLLHSLRGHSPLWRNPRIDDHDLTIITAESFLGEFQEQEDLFRQSTGFVGVTRFIRNHLVSRGYDHVSAYQLLQELDANGIVEVYHVPNPFSDFQTAAMRSVNLADDSQEQPK